MLVAFGDTQSIQSHFENPIQWRVETLPESSVYSIVNITISGDESFGSWGVMGVGGLMRPGVGEQQ